MKKEVAGKKFGRLYLESFKKQIVAEIEIEGSIVLICERHGLNRKTVQIWVNRYGSASYLGNKGKRRNVSERNHIAREIVSGKLSIEEVQLKYSVGCRDTVTQWVRKYKRDQDSLITSLPQATVPAEKGSLPGAASDLRLSELKIRALEVMLDIASKELKVDIRKKFGAKP
jgi:transposase-like protein